MTKKELTQELKELREELGEIRYKAEQYDKKVGEVEQLQESLAERHGVENMRIAYLEDQIRNLILRIDILTLTPEQIETMRKIKVRGRTDEPLDLTNRRPFDR